MMREAQRHLARLILQPIAGQMAEDASEKLGGPVQIDVVRPMQAFDMGGNVKRVTIAQLHRYPNHSPGSKTTKTACADFLYCIAFIWFFGSGGRDRTYDQLINSQLLYR